ncbi:small conductance mechanosensitive channel [Enhydrobacter aerosaccus]|uniref:Small-conductance mechanosensitive channel n=1 Tax=Enhydrobacter aerosaccus TaxID=225324 RepID=A0A1T4PQF0_9HYPH|nr:mechanosensitive ion channel domain-containing protein [Enhydrobacter aerosaccus]SJZ93854.1 small conductance mechanosensitive channel [Enhydrobacter aerosaccus]
MGLEQEGVHAANVLVALITTYGLRVIGAIAILLAGWIAARLVHSAIVRLCVRSPRIDRTVTLFLANGARYSVLMFTFVAVLTSFGIATTSIVAVLGAVGLAIGLALQGTLSNLAAGIMIVVFRPFHIGDRVESGGVVGIIREINLFYSELDTDDNVRVIYPNGLLWGQIVKIPSRNDTERVELKFVRPLSDDVGLAIERVRHAVAEDKRITRMAQIGVDTVADDHYVLVARMWVARPDAMQVHFDINRAVKEALQQHPPTPEQTQAAD